MEVKRYKDSDICYKQLHPETLKTVAYVLPEPLLPDKKVSFEEMFEAAHELSRELVDFKYNVLKGIGCSKIDTSICVNYYGKLFTVDIHTSLEEAQELYSKQIRQEKAQKLGLKIV